MELSGRVEGLVITVNELINMGIKLMVAVKHNADNNKEKNQNQKKIEENKRNYTDSTFLITN